MNNQQIEVKSDQKTTYNYPYNQIMIYWRKRQLYSLEIEFIKRRRSGKTPYKSQSSKKNNILVSYLQKFKGIGLTMLEKHKCKGLLTERLIKGLIIFLFIYNDFVTITIVTIQNIQYMGAQIILYALQKISFFYFCKELKWWQILLESLEVGILTIKIKEKQSKFIMIGYFLRVFFMLYCQFFILIAQVYFEELTTYKQALILASQLLITIIITIAQSMKFRYFLTFFTRWLFQIALFGLLLLLLVSQKQAIVIPYFILKLILTLLSNIIIFRKQYTHIKNQIRYAVFALIFYICIDHGPFYEFRRKKKDKDLRIVSNEVLLYTMHVFRLNQLLQIIDGIVIFLIDYFTAQGYGSFTITKPPSSYDSSDKDDQDILIYIRLISQILLAIFVTSFLVNQAIYFYADRWNIHTVFCVKKTQLKNILSFLQKNKNLAYFSATLAEIDKSSFSRDYQINSELQELVEWTLNLRKLKNGNLDIKIRDVNNIKLIFNKREIYEIDYVLHDFLILALLKSKIIKNNRFIYLEEDNQMTESQKEEVQNVLDYRVIQYGIHDIQIIINNTVIKANHKLEVHSLTVIAFYKLVSEYLYINPSYVLYDILN